MSRAISLLREIIAKSEKGIPLARCEESRQALIEIKLAAQGALACERAARVPLRFGEYAHHD
jgi:hypothetical protein